jgi:hypothetical protein
MRTKAFGLLLGAAFTLSACGGDSTSSGGGDLSSSEAQALTTALISSGAVGTEAAAFAPFVFTQLRQTGTMTVDAAAQAAAGISRDIALSVHSAAGDYQAVGVQVKMSETFQGTTSSGVYSGVFGWNGLNTSASPATVDHAISAGAFEDAGTTFPSSGSIDLSQGGSASYYDRATGSSYFANSGTVSLTSASFSGSTTNCGGTYQGTTVDCSYTKGTMKGSFNFTADRVQGTGPDTYTQATTSFDVPAVRFTIDVH